jgi:hypothetical protein
MEIVCSKSTARVFFGIAVALALSAADALAGSVDLKDRYSSDHVKSTCQQVNGEYLETAEGYGCSKGTNSVYCKKDTEKCKGVCPNCGKRQAAGGIGPVLNDVTKKGMRTSP